MESSGLFFDRGWLFVLTLLIWFRDTVGQVVGFWLDLDVGARRVRVGGMARFLVST